MKRIVELLILLYPRRWRDRYETEFKGLLEDMGPRWADLHDVLKGALLMRIVVWTPLKLSFACALIGALLCLAASFAIPGKFVSSGVLKVHVDGDARSQDVAMSRAVQRILSTASLTQIVNNYRLYDDRRTVVSVDGAIEEMRKNILIRNVGNPPIRSPTAVGAGFHVWFAYPNAVKAQAVMRELMDQFTRQAGFEVIDGPNLPTKTDAPNRLLLAAVGLSAGALIGGFALRLRSKHSV